MGTTAQNMIKALEVATGYKSVKHAKYDNQFYFTVNGTKLWVGCYAEYEITHDHVGKSGTRVPCNLVEAAAYVKSGGQVFPGGRGTVSGGLYQKSESQRSVNAASDIFGQVMAMLGEAPAPVKATTDAIVGGTVQAETTAQRLARLRAGKVDPRAAKKAEYIAEGASEEEAELLLTEDGY